jgi:hypothetical protein
VARLEIFGNNSNIKILFRMKLKQESCCATNWKVMGSSPEEVIEFFHVT